MSRSIEAEFKFEDEFGNGLIDATCTLSDGRISIIFNGVDHSATPVEMAKVIIELQAICKEGQEVVEIVVGDDCLWWAVVDVNS